MTDTRKTAENAISLLREKGWSKGSATGPDGSICMAVALCEGKVHTDDMDELSAFTASSWDAMTYIRRLFPERMSPWDRIADFNDHPDTTREDVLLVLKHMAEGE